MTLKHELLQTAAILGLPSSSFQAVNITDWESIMKKIENRFVNGQYDKWLWWWDGHFKDAYHAIVLPIHAFEILDRVIPSQEQVWFIAEE